MTKNMTPTTTLLRIHVVPFPEEKFQSPRKYSKGFVVIFKLEKPH
jgi:hypothetical protein